MKLEDSFLEPEVRDGFYIPSEVKQAWAVQLDLLAEIDRICKKYEIPYFADWGTLLGVVRHGGFIPWDDDLDITMKRADYQRFLEAAKKEMSEGYRIFSFDSHPDFIYFLKRFVAKERICFEEEHMKRFYGFPYMVGIDIFILDFVSKDVEKNEERNRIAKILIEAADVIADEKIVGKEAVDMLKKIEQMLGIRLKTKYELCAINKNMSNLSERDFKKERLHELRVELYTEAEKLFGAFSEQESEELTRMIPNELYENHKFRLSKKYYEKQVWLPFENTLLPVPSGYDEMLRRRYGDYMKLVRNCGGHDYPFFGTQKEQLQAVLDFEMPGYKYTGIAKRDKEQGRANSLKGIVQEVCQLLEQHIQTIKEQGEPIFDILQECQQLAIDMGTLIEQCKGEGHRVIHALEVYCEAVYQAAQFFTEETLNAWEKAFYDVRTCIQKDIVERKEAVFLPYKVADWEFIQSVWQAAVEDENCDVYVIPIPYFYKEYDGALKDMQYEAELFPKNLHVIHYEDFNFELHYPELVFIQNPYDEYNPVISVHPFFYSANLKQFTEKLVYIPPFVLEEFDKNSYREYYNMQYYCTVPGVVNADQVIVQSENMKQVYVEKLTEFAGEDTREIWKEKILGLGSPKADVNVSVVERKKDLPEEWKYYIENQEEQRKKIVLYYIGLSGFFQYKEKMFQKIRDVFRIFEENRNEVVIWWKPQSIIKTTLEQAEPKLYLEYCRLVEEFQEKKMGIFDEEQHNELAVEICDAYYGDASAIAQKFRSAGKPVMIQDVEYI